MERGHAELPCLQPDVGQPGARLEGYRERLSGAKGVLGL